MQEEVNFVDFIKIKNKKKLRKKSSKSDSMKKKTNKKYGDIFQKIKSNPNSVHKK